MNILWQNEHYPDVVKGGGGAVNTYYIVRSMLAQGHNAVILALGGDRQPIVNEEVNGTPVIRMPKPNLAAKLWPLWPLLESYYLKAPLTSLSSSFDGFVPIDAPYALAFKRLFPTRPLVYRVGATVRSHAAAVPSPTSGRSLSLEARKLNAVCRIMTY